jgi:hypothetical protein
MNVGDEWLNAIMAIMAVDEPDPKWHPLDAKELPPGTYPLLPHPELYPDTKPLATMLRAVFRGDTPLPLEILDALIELLDPGESPQFNVRLVPERIHTDRKEAELFDKIIPAVLEYDILCNTGKSANDARADVAKKYAWECDESTFNRHRKRVHAHMKRVRGEDITGKKSGK